MVRTFLVSSLSAVYHWPGDSPVRNLTATAWPNGYHTRVESTSPHTHHRDGSRRTDGHRIGREFHLRGVRLVPCHEAICRSAALLGAQGHRVLPLSPAGRRVGLAGVQSVRDRAHVPARSRVDADRARVAHAPSPALVPRGRPARGGRARWHTHRAPLLRPAGQLRRLSHLRCTR